ncbi:hypothetical protein [Prosthecobacter algae]|uniref:hypothetical protein n=1 Tax=Prosthecobacter algae TaxID=1144682 RepID=UPI0031EBFD4A
MINILIRLLTLNAQNVIPEILWALLAIYVLSVLVTITSVWSTVRSGKARFLWILVVVFVPFLGILAHCVHSLTLADLTSLKQFGLFTKRSA